MAIIKPWSSMAAGACIPTMPARPSYKVRSFTRFTTLSNGSGVGFILISPCIASDRPLAWYTLNSWTGTSGSTFSFAVTGTAQTTTTGIAVVFPNVPYATSVLSSANNGNINNQVNGRLVSVGVSIQYQGTELNKGGMYYILSDPNHQNLYQNSVSTLGNNAETRLEQITNKKQWAVTSAVDPDETDYSDNTTNGNTIDTTFPYSQSAYLENVSSTNQYGNGATPICIAFLTPANNQPFNVEIVQHIEYIGTGAATQLTPSHADPVGFNLVNSAASQLGFAQQSGDGLSVSSFSKLLDNAASAITTIAPYARAAYRAGFDKGWLVPNGNNLIEF